MQLLIMRHGEAEPYTDSLTDRQRMLTSYGQIQAEHAAKSLVAAPPDLMLVSPFVRTQQTAEIVRNTLLSELQCNPQDETQIPQQTCDWLQSEAPVAEAVKALQAFPEGRLLLVSHMPLVSLLVNYLTGHRIGFQPANVAEVELEYLGLEQGVFRWKSQ